MGNPGLAALACARCVPPAGAGTAEALAGQYGKACRAAAAALTLVSSVGRPARSTVSPPRARQPADE